MLPRGTVRAECRHRNQWVCPTLVLWERREVSASKGWGPQGGGGERLRYGRRSRRSTYMDAGWAGNLTDEDLLVAGPSPRTSRARCESRGGNGARAAVRAAGRPDAQPLAGRARSALADRTRGWCARHTAQGFDTIESDRRPPTCPNALSKSRRRGIRSAGEPSRSPVRSRENLAPERCVAAGATFSRAFWEPEVEEGCTLTARDSAC
jgi:hypothetical protein